jgi:hypothetical protein
LTVDVLFDVGGHDMRLVGFVDLRQWGDAARDDAALQALAEIVRLYLVFGFMAHAVPLSSRRIGKRGS